MQSNPFVLDEVFPDPTTVFSQVVPRVRELKKTAIFVLDTNSLLSAFKFGAGQAADICKQYRRLANENRLFVPRRAVQEFARNRPEVLKSLYDDLYVASSELPQKGRVDITVCPMLEDTQAYKDVVAAASALSEARMTYRKAIGALLGELTDWTWEDRISKLYAEIFIGDRVIDHKMPENQVLGELARRQANNVPPGFKDKAKLDGGIGDLLIWFSMLQLGRDLKLPVIFVCNETKTDWVERTQDTVVTVRPELPYEFLRETGQSFALVSFSRFLELVGAEDETVEQAREVEFRVLNGSIAHQRVTASLSRIAGIVDRLSKTSRTQWGNLVEDLQNAVGSFHVYQTNLMPQLSSASAEVQLLSAFEKTLDELVRIVVQWSAVRSNVREALRRKFTTLHRRFDVFYGEWLDLFSAEFTMHDHDEAGEGL